MVEPQRGSTAAFRAPSWSMKRISARLLTAEIMLRAIRLALRAITGV